MSYTNPKDLLLCYIVSARGSHDLQPQTFTHAVGYHQNGVIKDHMFDSFIMLSSPNYLYDYFEDGSYALKPLTKSDWLTYITKEELAKGRSIDALNTAVGKVKRAIGDGEYRANVFMTLFYPVPTVRDFGEVEGKNLDLAVMEDKKAALRWMADESAARFEAAGFEHLRLAGFYWYCEEVNFMDTDKGLTEDITDYVRQKGMLTCWCPFYGAPGYRDWKEMGFDIATQQANYFPEHRAHWPNRGGKERLAGVAADSKAYGLGVGMEMSDYEHESVAVFKDYMKAGVRDGFMQMPHIYYMDLGPTVVQAVAASDDPYLRSVYDELYHYIHRDLTEQMIIT